MILLALFDSVDFEAKLSVLNDVVIDEMNFSVPPAC